MNVEFERKLDRGKAKTIRVICDRILKERTGKETAWNWRHCIKKKHTEVVWTC